MLANKKGLTLIELLFTLSISATLSILAINSFFGLKNKNEKELLIHEIKVAILNAKLQSFSEGTNLILSPKSKAGDWSLGMMLSSKAELLYQWNWLLHYWQVQWQGVNGASYITISGTTHSISNGQFILSNNKTKEQIILTLNKLGRLRVNAIELSTPLQ